MCQNFKLNTELISMITLPYLNITLKFEVVQSTREKYDVYLEHSMFDKSKFVSIFKEILFRTISLNYCL